MEQLLYRLVPLDGIPLFPLADFAYEFCAVIFWFRLCRGMIYFLQLNSLLNFDLFIPRF